MKYFFLYIVYIYFFYEEFVLFLIVSKFNNYGFFLYCVGYKLIYGIFWIVYNNFVLCYYIFLLIEKMFWVMLLFVVVYLNKDVMI